MKKFKPKELEKLAYLFDDAQTVFSDKFDLYQKQVVKLLGDVTVDEETLMDLWPEQAMWDATKIISRLSTELLQEREKSSKILSETESELKQALLKIKEIHKNNY